MIEATADFKNILAEGVEPLYEELEITFPDGTKQIFLDEILPDGSEFSDGAGSSSFPIGSTICKTLTFDLDNTEGNLEEKKFYGAQIIAYLSFIDYTGKKTRIKKGTYSVTDSKGFDDVISVTAMDEMAKTNQLYISGLTLPQTADTLITDICTTLGISKGFAKLKHGTYLVNDIPEQVTYRQMIGYIAAINCANARIDANGYLQMLEWEFSDPENAPIRNEFEESPTFSQDDIQITGIRIKNGELEYLHGEAGYVLEIENALVDEQSIKTVASWIGDTMIGIPFRSMIGSLICDPLIEFGDVIRSEDRKGISYLTPITDVTYVHFGETEIKTQAQDPAATSSVFENQNTKTYEETKKYVREQMTAVNQTIEKLGETLAASSGMYVTPVQLEDGSTIFYYHDKPELSESTNVLKFTSSAIGISNDGGKTFPYGIVLDGTFIAQQLYSVGINADYITSGAFAITDDSGKVLFSADKDTKRVLLSADNVFIGENSITKRIEDIQNQTDGNIQTWTSSPEPALNNYPANQWLTDEEKSKHVGDVYYDSNNQAYRFRYDTDGYGWQLLKDTDVTKALQDAEEAKKKAEIAENVAALAKNVSLQLSNDFATIPVDTAGNYQNFPDITIKPIAMYGSSNITTECIYSIQKSDSVSGTWDDKTLTYKLDGLSADSGWVDVRATYLGSLSVTKRFNVSKLYQGEKGEQGKPGVNVSLEASSSVIRKTAKGVLIPNKITFNSSYLDESEAKKPHAAIFVIEETEDGATWREVYRSETAESEVEHSLYTILAGKGTVLKDLSGYNIATVRNIFSVRCSIYSADNDLIDRQTVAVVNDIAALTQEQVVDILSNGGLWKGLYYLNGHLYISFDAALGGSLTLGGENNGNGRLEIVDSNGKSIGYIDNTGVNFEKGNFTGEINGSVVKGSTIISDDKNTATQINAGAIRLRNTGLDSEAYIEDEETGELVYIGAENANWNDRNDIANAGYVQTESKYYPDFAESTVIIDDNVAVMSLDAFWGLFISAEKSPIAAFGKNTVMLHGNTTVGKDLTVDGDIDALGNNGQVHCKTLWTKNLIVDSTKSRYVETNNYQKQYMHAFETPTPMFADIGCGQTNEEGIDVVPIHDMFLETVNTNIEYQVFLQKEGAGDVWVDEKSPLYFVVKGTPNLKYSWEIKALQKDYEYIRFEDVSIVCTDEELQKEEKEMEEVQQEDLKAIDEEERYLLKEMRCQFNENSKNDIVD